MDIPEFKAPQPFKTSFAYNIFMTKYAQGPDDTWEALSRRMVEDVCGYLLPEEDKAKLIRLHTEMKWIAGGRYLYYAGRAKHFWNNCFLMRCEEDTREEWSRIVSNACSALMSGGGIGVDYSILRGKGSRLSKTGGVASGPLSLMHMVNEVGRYVMQGGSRRSAMYASLNWQHPDIQDFLRAKDWTEDVRAMKEQDFNFPAALDMTNISINWDNAFLEQVDAGNTPQLWYDSVRRMLKTGEPGHSYNFGLNGRETLRNACTEVTSEDDSDVCNLGSVNLSRIEDIAELREVTQLVGKFLVCGSVKGELPYAKVYEVREKNRRIGVGLMGLHEWLLKRGYDYSMNPELRRWLMTWEMRSEQGANELCDRLAISRPVKYRAIAPTGTIGILASTTTGIEPLFACAYKRRYLTEGTKWKYEYVVDATAHQLITEHNVDPANIETAYSLAADPEKRIKLQYEIQKHVDHAISSTLNLPSWGTELNNESRVKEFADMLLKYAPGLRGITCYPNGARGGQPLEEVPYDIALCNTGMVFDEVEEKCSGGVCGL